MTELPIGIDLSAGAASEIFDPAEAVDRACDDLDLLAELAELFSESRDRLLADLRSAVERGDADGIAQAAHALKGSIGTFSTLRPFQLVRELEFCGKERRLEPTPQLLDALIVALAELDTAVSTFLASRR